MVGSTGAGVCNLRARPHWGGERWEGGQGRSKDRGTVSWGLADEAEKEQPGRQEEKQESVVSREPSGDGI